MRIDTGPLKTATFSPHPSTRRIAQGTSGTMKTEMSSLSPPKAACFPQVLYWMSFPFRLPFIFLVTFIKGMKYAIQRDPMGGDLDELGPVVRFALFPLIIFVNLIHWILNALTYTFDIDRSDVERLSVQGDHFLLKAAKVVCSPLFVLTIIVMGTAKAIGNALHQIFKTREGELKKIFTHQIFPHEAEKFAALLIEVDTYPETSELHDIAGKSKWNFWNLSASSTIRGDIYAFINSFYSTDPEEFWHLVRRIRPKDRKMIELALHVPAAVREKEGAFWRYDQLLMEAIKQQDARAARYLLTFIPHEYPLTSDTFVKLNALIGSEALAGLAPLEQQKRLLQTAIYEVNDVFIVDLLTSSFFQLPFEYACLMANLPKPVYDIALDRFLKRRDVDSTAYLTDLYFLIKGSLFYDQYREALGKIIENTLEIFRPSLPNGSIVARFVSARSPKARAFLIQRLLEAGIPEDEILLKRGPIFDFPFHNEVMKARNLKLFEFAKKHDFPKKLMGELPSWLETANSHEWEELERIVGGFTQELAQRAFASRQNGAAKKLVESYGLEPEVSAIGNRDLALICRDWLIKHKNRSDVLTPFLSHKFNLLTFEEQVAFLEQILPQQLTVESLKPFFQSTALVAAAKVVFNRSASDGETIALFKALLKSDEEREKLFLSLISLGQVPEAKSFFEIFKPGSAHGKLSITGSPPIVEMRALWEKDEAFFLELLKVYPQLCLSANFHNEPLATQLCTDQRHDLLAQVLPLEPKMKHFGYPVHTAAERGDWTAIELLGKDSATGEWDQTPLRQLTVEGLTPFHHALFLSSYPQLVTALELFRRAPHTTGIPPRYEEKFKQIRSDNPDFVRAMLEAHFYEALIQYEHLSLEDLFEGLGKYIEQEKNLVKCLHAVGRFIDVLAKERSGEKIKLTTEQEKGLNAYLIQIQKGLMGHQLFIKEALESIQVIRQLVSKKGEEDTIYARLINLFDLLTNVFEFPKKDTVPCQHFIQRLGVRTRNAEELADLPKDLVVGLDKNSKVLIALDDSQKHALTEYLSKLEKLIKSFNGEKGYLEAIEDEIRQMKSKKERLDELIETFEEWQGPLQREVAVEILGAKNKRKRLAADAWKKLDVFIDELSNNDSEGECLFENPETTKRYHLVKRRVEVVVRKACDIFRSFERILNSEKVPEFKKLEKVRDQVNTILRLIADWGEDVDEHFLSIITKIGTRPADLRRLGLLDSVRLAVEADDDDELLDAVNCRTLELSPHFKASVPFEGKLSTGIKNALIDAEKKANMAKLNRHLNQG